MLERRAFAGRRKWRHPLFGVENCITSYLDHSIMFINNRNNAIFFISLRWSLAIHFSLFISSLFSISSGLRLQNRLSMSMYPCACHRYLRQMKLTITFLLAGDDTRNDNGRFNDSDSDSKSRMIIIRSELLNNIPNISQFPPSIIDLYLNDIDR